MWPDIQKPSRVNATKQGSMSRRGVLLLPRFFPTVKKATTYFIYKEYQQKPVTFCQITLMTPASTFSTAFDMLIYLLVVILHGNSSLLHTFGGFTSPHLQWCSIVCARRNTDFHSTLSSVVPSCSTIESSVPPAGGRLLYINPRRQSTANREYCYL